MEYRKERNFIVAYDFNNNCRGKWNILTNEFIGVRGTKVKTSPEALRVSRHPGEMPVCIVNAMDFIHCYIHEHEEYPQKLGQKVEELISLELKIPFGFTNTMAKFLLEDTTKLTKDIVTYIQDECYGFYTPENLRKYNLIKLLQPYKEVFGEDFDWAVRVTDLVDKNIPTEFVLKMINYGIHEKLPFAQHVQQFSNMLQTWYNYEMDMYKKSEPKRNILTNFNIIKYLHEEFTNTHYDEMLMKHNNCDWLRFENETLIVVPLVSRMDFKNEADHQQNCVERLYMREVVKGDTHVVGIRKKSDVNTPYITCEVNNGGRIIQYLGRFNRIPQDASARAFQRQYQEHLTKILSL
jgi:hypothetical protein